MATELTMPQMGYDMQEGTVVRWLKAEGSNVDLGEPVAEIETDKAVVEFESYASGVLREILVAEGSTVPVGEAIAVVGEAATVAPPAPEPEPAAEGESVQDAPAEAVAQDGAPAEASDSGEEVGGAAIPLGAASEPVVSEAVAEAEPSASAAAEDSPPAPAARVLATPIARQMARDAGIDLADIAGSGPGGRIVREDVLSAVESASAAEAEPETEPVADIAETESTEAVAASDEPEPEEAVEEAVAESEPEPEEAVEEPVAASDEPEPEEAVEEPVAAVAESEPEPEEAVEEPVAASDDEPAEAVEEPVAASDDEPEPEEAVEEAVAESDEEPAEAVEEAVAESEPEPEEAVEEAVAESEPEPEEAVEELVAASDDAGLLALSRTRRQIARVTTRSKSEKPHFYVNADVDMTAAMALRAQINDALAADGVRVTVNDMIIAASVIALKRFPKFNAYYEEGGIRMNDGVNVGVAMALEEGLIMPAIVGAGGMSLREIAQASKDLSERAQRGSLSASEYSGGTFAVSNMGMLGVTSFVAIIQPPQTAVLAIGSVQKRAVVGDGDQIAVRQMMTATLSADHRIVDGAEGAMFVNEIRTLLENPLSVIL